MDPHNDSGLMVPPENDTQAKFIIGCSDEDFEDPEDEDEVLRVIPPDGGWGWVVVAASFMCNAVVDGVILTSGMLYPNLRETFGATNSEVAWISSLLGGFYLLVGPFVSALANAFGFRIVCTMGAIIGASSCIISYFATSIYFLFVSFGIMGGMGFGLIYVPAVVAPGFYFEKRRALATGIAVCGSGIGTFTLSPLNAFLLTYLGDKWRLIFFVYAGIILCCAFFGLAFRPLSAATGKTIKPSDDGLEVKGTPLLMRIKRARDHELAQCPSALSMASAYSRSPSRITLDDQHSRSLSRITLEEQHSLNGDVKPLSMARALLDRHGGNVRHFSYPGIVITGPVSEPILEESENAVPDQDNEMMLKTSPSAAFEIEKQNILNSFAENAKANGHLTNSCNTADNVKANGHLANSCITADNNIEKKSDERVNEIPETLDDNGADEVTQISKKANYNTNNINNTSNVINETTVNGSNNKDVIKDLSTPKIHEIVDNNKEINPFTNGFLTIQDDRLARNLSAPNFKFHRTSFSEHSRRPSKVSLRVEASRPFYREDIFYSGSMTRIPQYRSSSNVDYYRASVTHLPPMDIFGREEEGEGGKKEGRIPSCGSSFRYVLSQIFDFSLLSSPTFIILSLSGFLALTSLFVPFNFLPSYAQDIGLAQGDVSFLMSLIGICNTVGRIFAGWVSDHPKVDALVVNSLALITGGVATIILPSLTNPSLLYCYAITFGLGVAAFASLRSVILVELLGLEKLTNAFGLLLLFQGFAAAFGSPIAGAFVDMTGEYKISFYVFGGLFALAGVVCLPLRLVKRWEDNRNDEKIRKEKYGL